MSKKQQNNNSNQIESSSTVRQVKAIPGLMTCVFTHKTSSTTAEFDWTGQKLNAIWPEVLAFLKWTYDTYHSESQLRLFVNKNTGEWKAWAFPQKANLRMSAKEITEGEEGYERTKEQRARFSDTDGWYYWGTVHHHCSTSAFQSGTDQQNEYNQDGVHITVGLLNSNQYDIHFRLYVSALKLVSITPLSFWDIGNEMESVPLKFRSLLPQNTAELLAKQQMGTPAPQGTEFPQEWRDNIIDVTPKPAVTTHTYHGSGPVSGGSNRVGVFGRTFTDKSIPNLDWDKKRAYKSIKEYIQQNMNNPKGLIKTIDMAIETLDEIDRNLHEEAMDIFAICVASDMLPGNLAKYIEEECAMEELTQQQRGLLSEGGPHGGHQPPMQSQQDGLDRPNHWYYGDGS